jgi:oligoribonuclease NrnB/cAMP/cGMP phosphodiesterase (DHH superfamily)
MICYYHSADLDGKASAAIVKSMYPHVELIPLDYGNDYEAKIFSRNFTNQTIFFVDVTLDPRTLMLPLAKENRLIVIDHHITAIEEIEKLGWKPDGILEVGKAACELTWEFLYQHIPMPIAVKYLGRYDVWDHSDIHTELFQYGMRYMDLDVDALEWEILLSEDSDSGVLISQILSVGGIVKLWNSVKNRKIAKTSAREVIFEGLRAIVCNGYDGSPLFDSVYNEEKHDIMISYLQRGDGTWGYGFYSDKPEVHCGEIAKKYGGGGHKGASGCNLKELIF